MNTRPGYKTTEFWITLITSAWTMFGANVPSPWNAVLPTIAGSVYAIARALAKGGVLGGTVGTDLNKLSE